MPPTMNHIFSPRLVYLIMETDLSTEEIKALEEENVLLSGAVNDNARLALNCCVSVL